MKKQESIINIDATVTNEPPQPVNMSAVITEAVQTPHIVAMHRTEYDVFFTGLLGIVHNITGRTLTEEQIRLYCSESWKDINVKYSWMRRDELALLMREGAKGAYGSPVYDIAYTTIAGWIEQYMRSPERADVVMELNKREPVNRALLSQGKDEAELLRSRMEHLREMAVVAWDIYTGNTTGGAAAVSDSNLFMLLPEAAFEYLEKNGFITMTPDEKKVTLEFVRKRIVSAKRTSTGSAAIKDSLFHVHDSNDEERFMKTVARKYCVAVYFQKLINDKKTFIPK